MQHIFIIKNQETIHLVMRKKHLRTFRPRLGFVILKLTQNSMCGEEIDSFSKISLLGCRNYDFYPAISCFIFVSASFCNRDRQLR